jgi:hypothetical protein
MRTILLSGLLFISATALTFAQTPEPPAKVSPAALTAVKVDPSPTAPGYTRLDKKQRQARYFKSMFGFSSIAKNVVGAGVSTWSNSPKEWGGQWPGFGKRVGSSVGRSVISNTTRFALEEAFKLDSRYIRSEKGFSSKIKNALISPVTARNEKGKRVFGFPKLAGSYASNIIASETWYPKRYSWKDGLRNSTYSIGTDVLINLLKEFVLR